MTSTLIGPAESLDSSADVLAFARARKADAQAAETDVLIAAVTWAERHPPESIEFAACYTAGDQAFDIAGAGAPQVAEFCIPEFALAIGVSTEAGKNLIGEGIEIAYRLPRLWARVRTGEVAAWRARRVAALTISLPMDGAAWVDSQVADFAHSIGLAALERLIAAAITRFDPDRAEAEALKAADDRYFTINHEQLSFDGTCSIEGRMDLADALDLEDGVSRGADQLQRLGSDDSLDVRRTHALGALGHGDAFLDYDDVTASQPRSKQNRRSIVVHLHLSEAATRSGCVCDNTWVMDPVARVENRQRLVTAEQVRRWCSPDPGGPEVTITVKPVIDLNDHVHVKQYEVPPRLAEQSQLRDLTCVFPWCSRAAVTCDCDHVVPRDKDGPTCSCNLAPLCRRHHRLKTHAPWSYVPLEPGSYIWTSPHGYSYLVDHTGTRDVTSREHRGRPVPPHAQQP